MKYTTAAAFRQALDQRLKNEAASTGIGVARLRKRVAFELFLRRLLTVAPDRWGCECMGRARGAGVGGVSAVRGTGGDECSGGSARPNDIEVRAPRPETQAAAPSKSRVRQW